MMTMTSKRKAEKDYYGQEKVRAGKGDQQNSQSNMLCRVDIQEVLVGDAYACVYLGNAQLAARGAVLFT